jgi:thiaminase/transcriptional activator TenA
MYDDVREFYDIATEKSSELIDKINKHPFNVSLMNNTLDYAKFKFYLQQDFLYLVDCTRALLIIAAKANDIAIMSNLANVAKGTFGVRDQYQDHFIDCDLSDKHQKSKSCSAFTDFFMRAAYHNSVAEGLAASYPCFCIYQVIIRYMTKDQIVSDNKYQKWIDIYSTDAMNNVIDSVTEIMNDLYKKSGRDEQKKMLEFFKRGLELEIAFWDEIYYSSNIPNDEAESCLR